MAPQNERIGRAVSVVEDVDEEDDQDDRMTYSQYRLVEAVMQDLHVNHYTTVIN